MASDPAPPEEATFDVAVVGAGAAGIAAGRTLAAAGLRAVLLEARDRVGGRCVTVAFGGHPVDLGAHWLHAGELNPLVPLARRRGERLRRAPPSGHVVVDGRVRGGAERRLYGQAFERADRAFTDAARAPRDRSIGEALPPLGRFGRPIAATMALLSGRPLREVSLHDFPSDEFGDNYFVRGGYGAYLARLAIGLPVRLRSPVRRIAWSAEGVALDVPGGTVRAASAIVTVPTAVLAAGSVAFDPALPAATADAIASFLPGTYEHVILNWPGSPFRGPDRLAKIVQGARSLGLMTGMDGAPFHYLELDHATVAAARTEAGLARLARLFLLEAFGARASRGLRVLAVTDWRGDPWSRAAWAVVPPGRAEIRGTLGRPLPGGRILFAGEANSRALWGTVGGAWQEGERAAASLAARLASRAGHVPSAAEKP